MEEAVMDEKEIMQLRTVSWLQSEKDHLFCLNLLIENDELMRYYYKEQRRMLCYSLARQIRFLYGVGLFEEGTLDGFLVDTSKNAPLEEDEELNRETPIWKTDAEMLKELGFIDDEWPLKKPDEETKDQEPFPEDIPASDEPLEPDIDEGAGDLISPPKDLETDEIIEKKREDSLVYMAFHDLWDHMEEQQKGKAKDVPPEDDSSSGGGDSKQ